MLAEPIHVHATLQPTPARLGQPPIPFERSYIPEPNSGCWLWLRHCTDKGYGRLKRRGVGGSLFAHRWSWEIHRGAIPAGLMVCHKCDVPSCVNPDHLFLGTSADNRADCVGKARNAKGRSNGRARLTEQQVYEIRSAHERQIDLAERYGVHQTAISAIKRRETWRHLPEIAA